MLLQKKRTGKLFMTRASDLKVMLFDKLTSAWGMLEIYRPSCDCPSEKGYMGMPFLEAKKSSASNQAEC